MAGVREQLLDLIRGLRNSEVPAAGGARMKEGNAARANPSDLQDAAPPILDQRARSVFSIPPPDPIRSNIPGTKPSASPAEPAIGRQRSGDKDTRKIKAADLPKFSGDSSGEAIDDWIARVSAICEFSGCSDAELLRVLPLVLEKEAVTWFTNLGGRRHEMIRWSQWQTEMRGAQLNASTPKLIAWVVLWVVEID